MSLRRTALVVALLAVAAAAAPAAAEETTTVWVSGDDPACSDRGPATSAQPLCTLAAAVSKAVAGTTVAVRDATYRETLKTVRSGSPGAPIVFTAVGGAALLLGSRDLSDPALWTDAGGGTWTAVHTVNPKQVFLDGVRLSQASSRPLSAHQWFWDSGTSRLHVQTDGGNPAAGHSVEAGSLTYGVRVPGHSDIVVSGFVVRQHTGYGVSVHSGASSVAVRDLDVGLSAGYGIRCYECGPGFEASRNLIADNLASGLQVRYSSRAQVRENVVHRNGNHGISVQGTTGSVVAGNVSSENARPTTRAAAGIDLSSGSSDNVVEDNIAHHNQDTGIQVYSSSNRNLVRRNVSHANGDHGYDTLRSTGTRYVSNTAYGNVMDGISIEGTSTGSSVVNCISVDNGSYELWVDTGSYSGFSSDHDVLWRSGSGAPIKVNGKSYASLRAFAEDTGHEASGTGADPLFVAAASGDLRLASGSPAIDSASASAPGVRLTDATGAAPHDDPATADTGVGDPTYLDRGAYEHRPWPWPWP